MTSFAEFYSDYASYVRSVARSRCGILDHEDIEQTVWLQIGRRWNQLDLTTVEEAKTYLHKTVSGVVCNGHRYETQEKRDRSRTFALQYEPLTSAEPFCRESESFLRTVALACRSDTARLIVILHFGWDWTFARIAPFVGMTPGGTRTHMLNELATMRFRVSMESAA